MTNNEIIILVVLILFWIISGFLSMDLHNKKGYGGGFLIGFLLGFVGLIYSAGLPDVRNKKVVKIDNNEEVIVSEDEEEEEDSINKPDLNECPNCFTKISKNDSECSNCGFKLK